MSIIRSEQAQFIHPMAGLVQHNVSVRLVLVFTLLLSCMLSNVRCGDGLSKRFYSKPCPQYEIIVSATVNDSLNKDPSVAPGLLRMLFHDAFVRGVDGSVLLNGTAGEKTAIPNLSLHGFDVIDAIKAKLESSACKGFVSCSDILATATRDAIVLTGGPFWDVELGRRDGNTSLASEVDLPSPFEDSTTLIKKFAAKGFTPEEMVLLQGGGHSIGIGHCAVVLGRLTNFNNTGRPDPTMNATFAQTLTAACNGSAAVALLNDPVTPAQVDNQYFVNIKNGMGLFTSDQELAFDARTRSAITKFATGPNSKFLKDFSKVMVKLSKVGILTGSQGSIRSNCAIAS